MRKLIFILGLSLMTTGAFAGNTEKEKSENKKEDLSQVCCRRGASTSSGENVTVRACVDSTGDFDIDKGKACERAKKAVELAIASLD